MAIRYNSQLFTQLEREVNRFNNKVTRLNKMGRTDIPSKVDYFEIKKSATSKADIESKIRQLQRFNTRGSEKIVTTSGGVDLTKFDLEELKRETRRIKTSLSRRITKMENIIPTSLGKKQVLSIKDIPTTELLNLKARRKSLEVDFTKLSDRELLDYRSKLLTNQRKNFYHDKIYKENYIDSMLTNMGYGIGYDSDKLKEIRQKLASLPNNKFLKLMDTEQVIQKIRDYYKNYSSTNKKAFNNAIGDIYQKYDLLYENLDNILQDYN